MPVSLPFVRSPGVNKFDETFEAVKIFPALISQPLLFSSYKQERYIKNQRENEGGQNIMNVSF